MPRLRFFLALCAALVALTSPLEVMGAQDTARPIPRTDINDLPLRTILAARPSSPVFAIFITGDGGWASIDKDVTAELADRGVNVVGLNSREYLHVKRSPADVARDLERIIRYYQDEWHRQRFMLVGYSRGADLAPFAISRLDSAQRQNVALVAMIGLGTRAGFEFHFEDIFRNVRRPEDQPILPELTKLRGIPMLCIYGSEEDDSGCRNAPDSLVRRIERPGSHHFNGNYRELADLILAAVR